MQKAAFTATIYNLLGSATPILVTIWTIPALIGLIGIERFGVIAILTLIVGYAGVFDFGLSRATSNLLARCEDNPALFRATFWTSIYTNIVFGFIGGVVVYLLLNVAADFIFNVSESIRNEVRVSIPWVAAMVPLITMTNTLNGTLDAKRSFFGANVIQSIGFICASVIQILSCIMFNSSVCVIVIALFAARLLVVLSMFIFVFFSVKDIDKPVQFDFAIASMLTRFGGWVAVTNIISQAITTSDQFIISNIFGVAAVAPYNIAYSIANKLLLLPIALMRSTFPLLSTMENHCAKKNSEAVTLWSGLVMGGVCCIAIVGSKVAFSLWLGGELGPKVHGYFNVLVVGVIINSLAFVPYTFLQSQRRPDLVAKLHAVELPVFLIAAFTVLTAFGPRAAPYIWTGRIAVDAVALFYLAGLRISPFSYFPIATVVALAIAVP